MKLCRAKLEFLFTVSFIKHKILTFSVAWPSQHTCIYPSPFNNQTLSALGKNMIQETIMFPPKQSRQNHLAAHKCHFYWTGLQQFICLVHGKYTKLTLLTLLSIRAMHFKPWLNHWLYRQQSVNMTSPNNMTVVPWSTKLNTYTNTSKQHIYNTETSKQNQKNTDDPKRFMMFSNKQGFQVQCLEASKTPFRADIVYRSYRPAHI